jgi:outer membrane protein W
LQRAKPMRYARALAAFVITMASAASVHAQSEGKIALGAQLSTRTPLGPENGGHLGVSFLWRFGQSKTGWRWHYGLNWFGTDMRRTIGGPNTDFGTLRVRPVMGGYGYTRVFGRTAVTGKLMGGYAFSSMKLSQEAMDAYQTRLGAQAVTVKASNAFVVIPEINVWYHVNKKVGIRVSSGYVIARPDVTVTSTAGVDKRRVKADNLTFKVGVVYSLSPFVDRLIERFR